MISDIKIKNFETYCESCQRNKLVRHKTVKPMVITTTSSEPLHIVTDHGKCSTSNLINQVAK